MSESGKEDRSAAGGKGPGQRRVIKRSLPPPPLSNPGVERFKRILREYLPELRMKYNVKSLWLFGSYVRGEARRRSDLDVLVEFESAPSLFAFIELEERLSELLGVKVDLVMKSALKPAIGRRILQEVIPI